MRDFCRGDRVLGRGDSAHWGTGVVWDAEPGYDNVLGKNVLKIRWDHHDYSALGFHGTPPDQVAHLKEFYIKQFIHDNCM